MAVITVSPKRDASVQLTMSEEKSIEAASRKLFGSEEVKGSGTTKTRVNDLSAGIGPFKVNTEQGPIDEIALLNQLEPKSPVAAGIKIKMVKAP